MVRLDRLADFYAEERVVAQAAGAVHIELAVRTGDKAQVAVGGVRLVCRGIREADLELAGHLFRLDEVHEVVARGFRIGQGVEILVRLHAGERRTHHVAREVAAAAHGDDAGVEDVYKRQYEDRKG